MSNFISDLFANYNHINTRCIKSCSTMYSYERIFKNTLCVFNAFQLNLHRSNWNYSGKRGTSLSVDSLSLNCTAIVWTNLAFFPVFEEVYFEPWLDSRMCCCCPLCFSFRILDSILNLTNFQHTQLLFFDDHRIDVWLFFFSRESFWQN